MKGLETEKLTNLLYSFDREILPQGGVLCGVDEAGRGPLCGPVCCAAVILDPQKKILGLNDSKKLTEKRRETLYAEIIEKAAAYSVVFMEADYIDAHNILNATMEGMFRAVTSLSIVPDYVIIDGNRFPEKITYPGNVVVKGDAQSASIAAASILAKVSRDRVMLELDKKYPQYCLAKHKGYGTKLHYEMIEKYGIQDFYRKSFLKKLGY